MEVDLDFDFLGEKIDIKKISGEMTDLLSTKFEIKDQSTKYNTLFWLVSYGKGEHNIKIEISTRENSFNHYNTINFYGQTIKILDIKDMIAHKMLAFTERPTTANRDLFDIHFFLNTRFASEINMDVIVRRTGLNSTEFYQKLLLMIKKINKNSILNGLGEVLTEPQKDWAKAKLLIDLEELIQRQIDFTIASPSPEASPTL